MPLPPSAPSPIRWTWLPRQRERTAEAQVRGWLGGELGAAPEALALQRDDHGRPHLHAPFDHHDCNWSHSGEGLLVALGDGVQVGIDLEWCRPRPRALELAQRFFAAAETAWLVGLDDAVARETGFLRLWCAKEAVLKAHGHGLSFGLDRLRFVDAADGLQLVACDAALGRPGDWSLQELAPADGYLGALAWRPRTG